METTSPVTWRTGLRVAGQVSVTASAWWSLRLHRPVLIARGSRLRVARSGRLEIAPGGALFLGIAHQTARIPLGASIEIGPRARLTLGGSVQVLRGARVMVQPGGAVSIGSRTFLNEEVAVLCVREISIGGDCGIAMRTVITDSDSHVLRGRDGTYPPVTVPVRIGDHVWLGTGCTVLKGVTVGDGAVVAARSLVRSDVPARSLAAGNPAQVIRDDVEWVLRPEEVLVDQVPVDQTPVDQVPVDQVPVDQAPGHLAR